MLKYFLGLGLPQKGITMKILYKLRWGTKDSRLGAMARLVAEASRKSVGPELELVLFSLSPSF